jgi:AcrR family transcriptional regulator
MKKVGDASAERPARAADRIRASASELFYREGIRAVGVDEVVERVGVTKRSYMAFDAGNEGESRP